MGIFLKLKDIDRRIIFLAIALAVSLPMVYSIDFPVVPGKNVISLYDFIEKLEPGTRTFLSFDYDPASMPELHPSAIAILVQMFRARLKPICVANWPVGGEMAERALASATQIFKATPASYYAERKKPVPTNLDLVKGKDYVNMGYKPGAMIHVKGLITDFLKPYPIDKDGNSTTGMEIFTPLKAGEKFTLKDVGIIVSFTAGSGGIETYIALGSEHKRSMASSCTSVSIPKYYTYLQTKQLIGLVGGLPGAAEYETLIDYRGSARPAMASQSISHLVIMAFIILGNLAYLAEKSKKA